MNTADFQFGFDDGKPAEAPHPQLAPSFYSADMSDGPLYTPPDRCRVKRIEIVRDNFFRGLPTEDVKRKRLQMWRYLMEYFPDAFLAEVEVAVAGNEQHNPGEPLHWAREKSKEQMECAFRHMFDYGLGVKKDTDGQWHLAKARWRLGAQLQLDIEAEQAKDGT